MLETISILKKVYKNPGNVVKLYVEEDKICTPEMTDDKV